MNSRLHGRLPGLGRFIAVIERHLGLVFVAAFVLGLTIPAMARVPPGCVMAALALIIFLACFQIAWQDLRALPVARLLGFAAGRFLVLPIAWFWLAKRLAPEYAVGALLIGLMPSGVSAPALSGVMGGKVSHSLALLILSTAAVPFTVPIVLDLVAHRTAKIDQWALFTTLAITVFSPALLHLPFRASARIRTLARTNLSWISIVAIALAIATVVAKRRDTFLGNPNAMLTPIAIAAAIYATFYGISWMVPRASHPERVSLMMASGVNNIVLGISVGLMYFSGNETLFLVMCELPWIGAVVAARRLL
ncbi:MAG: hypothetical protein IPK13_15180 [Deltaproteobacteria bacterium]|nr:hypothetical protein [Deltaproteobacteria bacterium]